MKQSNASMQSYSTVRKTATNIISGLFQLLTLTLALASLADTGTPGWPDFLGPTRNSKSQEKIDIRPWGKAGPPVVWHKQIGTSYGAPTVANGCLFIFARHRNMARLTCMESTTGNELWRYEYPTAYEDMYGYNNGPRCCPVIDEDRVYIFGADGILHCVRVSDGKGLWKIDTMAQFHVVQNFFGVASAPAVEGELLIVQIGGSPPGSPKDIWGANGSPDPNGSGIVAFNKHTGEVVYQIADELASYASPIFTTIDDRRWGFA
ncbi:PQQ-binding-like beta-propeller repeat protein, partial [Candidatus Poribacteria bacterium]|nr:PQQ-binding-like beta-propeller repeat protein [Candidatus Poribacteria bacterium]